MPSSHSPAEGSARADKHGASSAGTLVDASPGVACSFCNESTISCSSRSVIFLQNTTSTTGHRVQMLQRIDRGPVALHRADALNCGLCGGNGGDGGNARQHRGPANGFLIEEGVLPARRVDDELDAVALDQVHNVRPALLDLEDALNSETGLFQHIRRALGSDDLEA